MGYTFGEAPAGGKKAKSVHGQLPERPRERRCGRAEAKRWLLSMDGRPAGAAEGGQLGADDVRRAVRHRPKPSEYHDINGANTPETVTVGQGPALIFRDGQVFEGAWSRPKAGGRDVVHDRRASRPSSPPGQVWVALLGRDRPVTVG